MSVILYYTVATIVLYIIGVLRVEGVVYCTDCEELWDKAVNWDFWVYKQIWHDLIIMKSQNVTHRWKIPWKLMQRPACKVHTHFAADSINHCQLMYFSFTSGHRTYHQHIVKSRSCRRILTLPFFPQLHLANHRLLKKRTMSLSIWPAQSITSLYKWLSTVGMGLLFHSLTER